MSLRLVLMEISPPQIPVENLEAVLKHAWGRGKADVVVETWIVSSFRIRLRQPFGKCLESKPSNIDDDNLD